MYQFTPSNKRKSKLPIIIFIGSLMILSVLVYIFRFQFMSAGNKASESTQDILQVVVTGATPKTVLLKRQAALEQKIAMLEQQLLGVQLIEDENRSLREILAYPLLENEQKKVVARVIAKPSQSFYDRIIIDRGESDGVAEGSMIIAGENILVAKIDSVNRNNAQALLLTGNFFSGDVVITRLGVTVPIAGKGSGNFELHVPRDLDVRDGDILTLPGYPQYIVGVIKSVQFDDRDPYQTVLARIPINVQELKFVRVVNQ